MADIAEQFDRLRRTSVEDAVRWAIRDPKQRQKFREQWPMYQADALKKNIDICNEDIELYEKQIQMAMAKRREYQQLLEQCIRRDAALVELAKRRKSA